jgi:hypothetical protein
MVVHFKFEVLAHHVSEEGSHLDLHVLGDGSNV